MNRKFVFCGHLLFLQHQNLFWQDCSFRTVMFEDPSAINSSVRPGSKAILSFEVNSGCCINNDTVVVYLDVEAGAEDQSSEDSLQDPGGNSLEDAFFRFMVKIMKSTFFVRLGLNSSHLVASTFNIVMYKEVCCLRPGV